MLLVYAYANVSLMMVKNWWEYLKHELVTLREKIYLRVYYVSDG